MQDSVKSRLSLFQYEMSLKPGRISNEECVCAAAVLNRS